LKGYFFIIKKKEQTTQKAGLQKRSADRGLGRIGSSAHREEAGNPGIAWLRSNLRNNKRLHSGYFF